MRNGCKKYCYCLEFEKAFLTSVLAMAAVSQEKWVSVEEPVVVFPLHDPYLSLEKSAFH